VINNFVILYFHLYVHGFCCFDINLDFLLHKYVSFFFFFGTNKYGLLPPNIIHFLTKPNLIHFIPVFRPYLVLEKIMCEKT